jgi:hypothetical protein
VEESKWLTTQVDQQKGEIAELRKKLSGPPAPTSTTAGQPCRVACYTTGDGKPGVFIKAVAKWYDFGTDGSVTEFEDITGATDNGFYHLKSFARGTYVRLYKAGEAFESDSEAEKGKAKYRIDWRK